MWRLPCRGRTRRRCDRCDRRRRDASNGAEHGRRNLSAENRDLMLVSAFWPSRAAPRPPADGLPFGLVRFAVLCFGKRESDKLPELRIQFAGLGRTNGYSAVVSWIGRSVSSVGREGRDWRCSASFLSNGRRLDSCRVARRELVDIMWKREAA